MWARGVEGLGMAMWIVALLLMTAGCSRSVYNVNEFELTARYSPSGRLSGFEKRAYSKHDYAFLRKVESVCDSILKHSAGDSCRRDSIVIVAESGIVCPTCYKYKLLDKNTEYWIDTAPEFSLERDETKPCSFWLCAEFFALMHQALYNWGMDLLGFLLANSSRNDTDFYIYTAVLFIIKDNRIVERKSVTFDDTFGWSRGLLRTKAQQDSMYNKLKSFLNDRQSVVNVPR